MMNRDWWASPTEAFIYNEFADALREGLRLGVLDSDDLMTEDDARPGQARRRRQSRMIAGSSTRSATSVPSRSQDTSPASSPRSAGSTRPC